MPKLPELRTRSRAAFAKNDTPHQQEVGEEQQRQEGVPTFPPLATAPSAAPLEEPSEAPPLITLADAADAVGFTEEEIAHAAAVGDLGSVFLVEADERLWNLRRNKDDE